MTGGRSKNEAAPKGLDKYELTRKALSLRAGGATYREIGATLGCTHTWARTVVLDAMRENTYEDVKNLREEEAYRLERLQRAIWPNAMTGDVKAVLAVLRIMERRARMFGIDAPVQVDVEATIDHEGAVLIIEGTSREQYLTALQQARPKAAP